MRLPLTAASRAAAGLVRAEGVEPPRLSSREPKSRASISSATPATGIPAPKVPGGAAYITASRARQPENRQIAAASPYAARRARALRRAADIREEAAVNRGHGLGQVFRDQAGAHVGRGFPMHPGGHSRSFEARHALGEKPSDEAREHVAGAGSR